jgi:phosphatidylserine/phosphatidylglycerophosphate/cardiolipin synthase-like enzyme
MKLKIIIAFICLPIYILQAQLNGNIKIYFTNPVNTNLSSGINAIYLNNSMDDTLVEYINRAKYTLDIAVYNYQQSTGMANIATAINNAEARGVVVRWIYDGSQSNSGMSALNGNIHTLGSPTTSAYGIMHNKFMIVDANSANLYDPLVWTGSTNWTKTHFNSNVNNTVVIQDKNLALAYLTEFNEMWGDVGITPNLTLSKFGPFKTNNTTHNFTIGGAAIELYFSPTDVTNSKVLDVMKTANSDLYFGMLTFSLSDNSDSLISIKNKGIYVAGIIDQSSQIYSPYSQLNAALSSNFKVYSQFTSVYHNKILVVDPCNLSSNPTVVTGSYNWTTPAETKNDENALIIHDASVANIFHQSFSQNFTDLGGTLSACSTVNTKELIANLYIKAFPNPFVFETTLQTNLFLNNASLSIYTIQGQEVKQIKNISGQTITVKRDDLPSGLYFIRLTENGKTLLTDKLMITDN